MAMTEYEEMEQKTNPHKNYKQEDEEMSDGSRVAEIIAARDRGDNDGGTGFGGGLGGVLLGGILAGGFGLGRGRDGNDCAVSNCQNSLTEVLSDFNATQHNATMSAIQTGAAASVAATHNAATQEAIRDVDKTACNGFLQGAINQGRTDLELAKGFGNVSLESCRQTGILSSQIAENKFAMALGFANASKELSDCCCEIKMTTMQEAQGIKDLINNNTMQDLRDKNEKLFLELSQCRQTAELTDLKHDIKRQGDTVIAIGNTLTSVVNAVNSLVAK